MFKNKRRLFTFTVALLAVVALWGVLLTGTATAQSSQPTTPGQEWHYGMMGHGMMGDHMGYGYGMQAGVPVTGTAPYQGWGMMGYGCH